MDETPGRNINLIIGPNGSGKTELLFAFRWILSNNMDFTNLLGKEKTPYSINSTLYNDVKTGKTKENSCSVELELENEQADVNKRTIIVKKKDVYEYIQDKAPKQSTLYELAYINADGSKSLPIEGEKSVSEVINSIIPSSILYGIAFDGERMQQLSSPQDTSRRAIEGLIANITSVEFFTKCQHCFDTLQNANNEQYKKIAKSTKNKSLEQILTALKEAHAKELALQETQKTQTERLEKIAVDLEAQNEILKENKETQDYQQEREDIEKNLKRNKKDLFEKTNDYGTILVKAYLRAAKSLYDQGISSIEKTSVPFGLTTEAVDNVIKSGKCICGKNIDNEVLSVLKQLRDKVPPTNLNSTIAEMIDGLKNAAQTNRQNSLMCSKDVTKLEKEIKENEKRIAFLTAQIGSIDQTKIREAEAKISSLNKEQGKLENSIDTNKNTLKDLKHAIEVLEEQRDNATQNSAQVQQLQRISTFIKKSFRALTAISDSSKEAALKTLNLNLKKAFSELSMDEQVGRRIAIIQDKIFNEQYQIVSYYQEKYDEELLRIKEKSLYGNLSPSQKQERAILNIAEGNSTGQSKMNTLAFVKAILDYANSKKDPYYGLEKNFPLLIDAPFGDIFDNNLIQSAKKLHDFSDQIILFLAQDSYDSVKQYIEKYVSTKYELCKNLNEPYSKIKKKGDNI